MENFDARFNAMTVSTADVEGLYEVCRWAEGPVWFADGGFLVSFGVPKNRMLSWTPNYGTHPEQS
ncbi:MAG: hypothetical protein KJO42_16915 [Silicimonas sp.]|nr:hypothetical protein [Silicimonas sp.]